MKAVQFVSTRVVYSKSAFAELALRRLPKPADGSRHSFKYRLAYVVRGECVLRYDNEAGKGDHRHEKEGKRICVFNAGAVAFRFPARHREVEP